MYSVGHYINRGVSFLHNQWRPKSKILSTLMIYGTDLCDSACKHCLIWTKRPVNYLSFEKIKEVMQSHCITKRTTVGLEGGEFLLHPQAIDIMKWFNKHHPNFDLLSNGLRPELLIEAVEKHPPKRLFISLDGDKNTYFSMRGKDGYEGILRAIETLHKKVPISLMFTLSPYNDFTDLKHVANVAKNWGVDMRIGVYNDISFFDTIDSAHQFGVGSLKNSPHRTISEASALIKNGSGPKPDKEKMQPMNWNSEQLPDIIKEFPENYDFLVLYDEWRRGNLNLKCHSILDSLVILPNGDVPICQQLNVLLGNLHVNSLDQIFNGPSSVQMQKEYSKNCNACWINFHRKYDIILYRTFEKFFGKMATGKLLGYYWWEKDKKKTYRQMLRS